MRTFVTGATGFVGAHAARRLAEAGHELHCLVRKTSKVEHLKDLGATLVEGDVSDRDSLMRGMQGCDWVANLANVYSFWERDRRIFRRVNVDGTLNVMECALQAGAAKVLHVSSAVVFGKPTVSPFTEEVPVGPSRFSEYARTKYEGDLIAWDLSKKRGLPLVVVYPAAILGTGDNKATGQYMANLVNRRLPIRMLDDSVMTYVHVGDVADAIVRVLEKENNTGEKYLLGSEQLSMREISGMVCEIAGVPLPRMSLPDVLVPLNATLFTLLANLTKSPPAWGMSTDMVSTVKEGFRFDGSKAARELGIIYTPVRKAVEEAIAASRARPVPKASRGVV